MCVCIHAFMHALCMYVYICMHIFTYMERMGKKDACRILVGKREEKIQFEDLRV